MAQPVVAPHGLFYKPALLSMAEDERQPSWFALEEEKGEGWNGSGATSPAINEARPSL